MQVKQVICINTGEVHSKEGTGFAKKFITLNKIYDVLNETNCLYCILCDDGHQRSFFKERFAPCDESKEIQANTYDATIRIKVSDTFHSFPLQINLDNLDDLAKEITNVIKHFSDAINTPPHIKMQDNICTNKWFVAQHTDFASIQENESFERRMIEEQNSEIRRIQQNIMDEVATENTCTSTAQALQLNEIRNALQTINESTEDDMNRPTENDNCRPIRF